MNYNVRYFLEQCILSVKAATQQFAIEIIVVDNNSVDDSCEMLQKQFPDIQLITNVRNVGFSAANNQGVAKSQGKYVLILNPDTVIAEDTFEQIIDFAQQQDNLGALGVKFIDGRGNFLPECKRNIPTIRIAIKKILGDSKEYYACQIQENENVNIEILTGAFMLMKRKTFLDIGGFDEGYFMYGEDVDLSYKLLKNGFQNYYVGTTTIIHYKGESTLKDISNFKHFYGAMSIFYRKYFKTNHFYIFFSKLLFRGLVMHKTLFGEKKVDDVVLARKVLFVGEDQDLFERINRNKKFEVATMNSNFVKEVSNFDLIIFDNSFVSNKKIIEKIQELKNKKILKRILPQGANYYLGSDSSNSQGEVIVF